MAMKAILMLLIGNFVVQIYSNRPNRQFVEKHVCSDCQTSIQNNGPIDLTAVQARRFAANIESTVMRSKLVTVQTIYMTQKTTTRDWKDIQGKCESKSLIDKYRCRKLWFCRKKADSKARHRKTDRCPDLHSVNLCSTCQNVDAETQTLAVQKYALRLEKDKYDEIKQKGKQYVPISAQTIHVVNGIEETRTTFWTSPQNDKQFCEMNKNRPEYECTSSWDCSKGGTGKGSHNRNDGHLREN